MAVAKKGEIKLLGQAQSSFVIRVQIALEQKGISYEYLEEDIFNKSELLLKHNPIYKKVPVLIHGDRSVCESLVILQYIDENWPAATGPPLIPADPYDCAMARFWAQYADDKLIPAFIDIMKAKTEAEKAEKIADTLSALELLEGAFKKCSGGKDFFGGDSVNFLDVALGSLWVWIRGAEEISGVKLFDETKVPLLVRWVSKFNELDFVKCVLPSVESVAAYGREIQAKRWKAANSAK